ncbi:MAG TPA: hemerythrin domain-containing protein [Myxococcaceae bacterium]|nr:hemerythrin domain-containing protein [Myxococcaceae bacterium]
MDATKLLIADHKTVEGLFKQFEKAGKKAGKTKRKIADQVIRELSVHAVIEEQVFYPALRERSDVLEDMALEALEEHHVAKWTLSELEGMPPEHERFEAKMKVLMENIRHHVKEEERELFPKVRKAFKPDELRQMGEALEAAKVMAPTHPHPRSPDEPPGNIVAGTFAKVMDTGRDVVKSMAAKTTRAKRGS